MKRRLILPLLAFSSAAALAQPGYVYSGDLNGDGIADTIESGPVELFGNGGGPFVVSLSDARGGFVRRQIELHPAAVALDHAEGHARLWTYWRSSSSGGMLGVTTLDDRFETRSVRLDFGADPESPTLSRELYRSIFRAPHRIEFERVENHVPPPAVSGEWGK